MNGGRLLPVPGPLRRMGRGIDVTAQRMVTVNVVRVANTVLAPRSTIATRVPPFAGERHAGN